ncbi:MAG: DUF5615 family PIN-like protein [Verrucomicrobiota bacterium]
MKFFVDQDVYALTTSHLRSLGHEVLTAHAAGLSAAADSRLLAFAQEQGRLFVTRDRDFGGLAFVERKGSGIIYLRLLPSTVQSVHGELSRVLQLYSAADLEHAFVVVEPGRHRFRRIS